MIYTVEHLAQVLKEARTLKHLSQRALSSRVGIPQAQISKIENAAVDLRVSTLIELARTLGLELMLVPRKHVPVVEAWIKVSESSGADIKVARPAYRLEEEDDDG